MSEIARHWIDGQWVGSDTISDSVNPATGTVLGQWADGGEAEARAAVPAARRAFDTTGSISISRRVSREIRAGTVWTNMWAAVNDGFAEGGYQQSGIGRLRGPLAITEFQEAKTVVHAVPPTRA